jgi:catechol 2,3-dioxygenase-like lactoylglutathione lyase family enzyme
MQKPKPTNGLRHVALFIKHFDACEHFYTQLLDMKVDWRPDPDNLYLTSGSDNFAMHRAPADFVPAKHQRLDHIGFFLDAPVEVDKWFDYLSSEGVKILAKPKDHRDGTRSFYCADPDGNVVQMIYVPLKSI